MLFISSTGLELLSEMHLNSGKFLLTEVFSQIIVLHDVALALRDKSKVGCSV